VTGGPCWAIGSVAYHEDISGGFTLLRSTQSTESGTDTTTLQESDSSGATTAYGGGTVTGVDSFSGSQSGSASVTAGDAATLTEAGQASFSLTEQGSSGGPTFGLSLTSVVYQGGASASDTLTEASAETFGGSATGTSTAQGQGNQLSSSALDSGSALDCFTGSGAATCQDSGGHAFSATSLRSSQDSFYQAGAFAGGSWSLSSVAYRASGTDGFGLGGTDTDSEQGTESTTAVATGSDTSSALAGGASSGGQNNGVETETVTGSFSASASDSYGVTGADSWSLSDVGSYANFSYTELSPDPARRRQLWREFVCGEDLREAAIARGDWAVGDDGFRGRMTQVLGRPLPRPRGRPPKAGRGGNVR
jgi:hypothetical protein